MKRYTYAEIADDWNLWCEYVGITMSWGLWHKMSLTERMDILVECYGPEQEEQDDE